MTTTTSKDGTRFAFDKAGQGPAVIFIDGALCYRASGPSAPVASLLKEHFTVFTYDRRGRGDSGNTLPYAVEREVEDIAALLQEAGCRAMLCGVSSGAALSLEAASRLPGVAKMALYEAPFIVDDTHAPLPPDVRRPRRRAGVRRRAHALQAGLEKTSRRRAHAPVRHHDCRAEPARHAAPIQALERRDNAGAGDRRREEPGLDTKRHEGTCGGVAAC